MREVKDYEVYYVDEDKKQIHCHSIMAFTEIDAVDNFLAYWIPHAYIVRVEEVPQ